MTARGYPILPLPQRVALEAGDFELTSDWAIHFGGDVSADDVAVHVLEEELSSRFGLQIYASNSRHVMTLEVRTGSVAIGAAADRNVRAIELEAYSIDLHPGGIRIRANAGPGLFYAVTTLLQLVRTNGGHLWLPEAAITDWPDTELRHIYWDDAHHLERMSEFKRIIRQAALYKVNGIALKLEGHFQYASAPPLVEPEALTPSQLQELTDYARRFYVQLIPYLDAPAHIAFILKHPEYAKLRSFPDSNYELCATNPDAIKLVTGMYADLLAANKGVDYFYLSTDEAYYIGMADNAQCNEVKRARALGSPGKLLAEFLNQTAGYLHGHGRTVIFWGEYPLKPSDIDALPSYLVNGETYGPEFDRPFRAHGIVQMLYTASEGEEKLFPSYFPLPSSDAVQDVTPPAATVMATTNAIYFDAARTNSDLIGAVNAGWGDMGLHPETFWLGYVTATAAAWHPGAQDAAELTSAFFAQFYRADSAAMNRTYQLMSQQAQFWTDSWDSVDSTARKPIWGNSYSIFHPPQPAKDQTIPLPSPDLKQPSPWLQTNEKRVKLTQDTLSKNDELLGLLYADLRTSRGAAYNLQVFLAIASLYRQNLEFLTALAGIDRSLNSARSLAAKRDASGAVKAVDAALDGAIQSRKQRNRVLDEVIGVWYQSWLPRVEEANGRRFLHELDDVKDHLPDRTVDMSYLILRELQLPLDDWFAHVREQRNLLAATAGIAKRDDTLDWKNTK